MKNWITNKLVELGVREEGQGTVEYAAVLGVLVVGVVGLWNLTPIQSAMNGLIGNITSLIPVAGG